MTRRALVLGGSGAVGEAVLRLLRARDVEATFTYHRSRERAEALARELGHRAHALDLADAAALTAFVRGLYAAGDGPDVAIHCAGVLEAAPALEVTDEAWERAWAVNGRSAFVACRELARGMAARGRGSASPSPGSAGEGRGGGSIVLVGALDRGQSLPIPVAFACAQGMLPALAMSLAHEVGPKGVRVNLVALGLLERGLSSGLSAEARADYVAYSALRRLGTPEEAATPIVWLALDDAAMNGKVLAVNGGL